MAGPPLLYLPLTSLLLRLLPLCAVRGVIFTVDPTKAGRAGAGVAVDAICAISSIFARVAFTLVNVLLARCAPKPEQAGAQEVVHLVLTAASVVAGVCGRESQDFTVSSLVSMLANIPLHF